MAGQRLGWDCGISLNELCHHTTCSLQAHGQWSHVQEQEILDCGGSLASENCSLHSSTVRYRLVWVDGLVWLLAIEEFLDHRLHLWDTSGAAHEHHIMYTLLVDSRILQALLHWAHGVAEIVHAKLLEACPRQTAGVVNSLEQGINFNSCLSRRGQGALGTLTLCSQAPDGTLVASHVLVAILPLEVLDAEIHDSLVTACHASNLIPLLLSTSTEELEKVYPVLK